MFLAYTKHDYWSDIPPIAFKDLESAIDEVHEFFLSYGFELRDGMPFDPGNDDGGDSGFEVFSNVGITDGKVYQFTHCNGDGPIGKIEVASIK